MVSCYKRTANVYEGAGKDGRKILLVQFGEIDKVRMAANAVGECNDPGFIMAGGIRSHLSVIKSNDTFT